MATASPLRALFLLQPREAPRLALSCAYFFCLLASYYMLRPIREQMGIAGGVRNLPWLMTGTLAAMLLVNPLYGLLAARLPRRRFVPLVYLFFAANILLFWAVMVILPARAPAAWGASEIWIGRSFYIWTSVFNLFVVSVFWSAMIDAWSPEQAKRLFGAIGMGGTLGAIVGALAVERLSVRLVDLFGDSARMHLLLGSAALLVAAVGLFSLLARSGALDRPGAGEPGPDPLAGIRRTATSPYLQSIVLYMLLFTITGTLLYVEQARIVESSIAEPAEQTRFFARIDLWTNVLTLLIQAFVTGRLVMWLGLGTALVVMPLVTFGGFAWLLAAPTLAAVAAFQVVRRAGHYAIDRPSREALFSVLGADDRYKAKSLIDTFVYRAGDAVGAWAPKWVAHLTALAAAPTLLAGTLALAWIACAVLLGRQNARRARAM